MVATNSQLPFEGVVLLVCQISGYSCLQNDVSNKFDPKNYVSHEKKNKIWWVIMDLKIIF